MTSYKKNDIDPCYINTFFVYGD